MSPTSRHETHSELIDLLSQNANPYDTLYGMLSATQTRAIQKGADAILKLEIIETEEGIRK